MIKYRDWVVAEGATKMYELYVNGPGIAPIADKVLKCLDGVSGKAHLVVKFTGDKETLKKAERAMQDAGFVVIDAKVEHD